MLLRLVQQGTARYRARRKVTSGTMRRTALICGALGCASFVVSLRGAAADGARPHVEDGAPPRMQGGPSPRVEWTPRDEEARAAHHARSLWEMSAGLALGTAGYWLLLNRNIVDWDDPQLKKRFDGSAWVLDNNHLAVNFLGHPATGGLSYSFARSNHQSVLGSFGYAFLTSFAWEFAIEFKEKVSVNDVIVTPGAGLPLGELFYKLGLYLDSGRHDSTWVSALRWLLGTGVALDRRLDGRPPPVVISRDHLGFSSRIWHRFEAAYGLASVSAPGVSAYARGHAALSARLVTLADYHRAGSWGRWFHGAELSELTLGVEASRHGAGLLIDADTIVAGYHAQALARGRRSVSGHAVTLGSSIGFDYLYSSANRSGAVERAVALREPHVKYHVPRRREQLGALGLPGLALDVSLRKSWGNLDFSGRLQPSFAGLSAPAFYDWTAAHPDERSKHVLHRQGYFYGWGGMSHLKTRLALGAFALNVGLVYGGYVSQNGLDRHRERLTHDTRVTGDVLRYWLSLGVAPTPTTQISIDWGVRRFRSRAGGFERTARAEERGMSVRWGF
jgi:Domain of unknown function (DUF3943)